ncbi:MAG: chalcone isomerase family protein [bacterium]|nr:chalcone isomerase family protein [bacterium]
MRHRFATAAMAVALLLAGQAGAIVESKTGTEYPDSITVATAGGDQVLVATGAALREKSMLKIDIYTIASWVASGTELGADRAAAIWTLEAPKRLRMDLRRSFSREKLIGAFREVIEKNYADQSAISTDLATFEGYFTRDAESGDVILFTYLPGQGLTTDLNGETRGVIANPTFVEALWSVWFGPQPVDDGMKAKLSGTER